jgi:hypothetical protein
LAPDKRVLIQGIAISKGVAIRESYSVDMVSLAGSYNSTINGSGNDDEAVNNVISETRFGWLRIVKVVDHLIYLRKTDIEE